jgi:hypothetical protein
LITICITTEIVFGWFFFKHWSPIDGQPKHFSVTNHCYLLLFVIEFLVALCTSLEKLSKNILSAPFSKFNCWQLKNFKHHPTIKIFQMVTKTHFLSPSNDQDFLVGSQNPFLVAFCIATKSFSIVGD